MNLFRPGWSNLHQQGSVWNIQRKFYSLAKSSARSKHHFHSKGHFHVKIFQLKSHFITLNEFSRRVNVADDMMNSWSSWAHNRNIMTEFYLLAFNWVSFTCWFRSLGHDVKKILILKNQHFLISISYRIRCARMRVVIIQLGNFTTPNKRRSRTATFSFRQTAQMRLIDHTTNHFYEETHYYKKNLDGDLVEEFEPMRLGI